MLCVRIVLRSLDLASHPYFSSCACARGKNGWLARLSITLGSGERCNPRERTDLLGAQDARLWEQ